MLIGKKINLSLEEKFNLFIKNRISKSYINGDGDLINVFSSSKIINKELLCKGIDYRGKNIDDLILEIENLSTKIARKDFENLNMLDLKKENCEVWEKNQTVSEQLIVLKDCVLELAFFLNDYQYERMSLILQKDFEKLRQFSCLLRKNKFLF